MGGKRSGKRKHIHLCIAVLILLGPLACAFDQMMSTKMVDASGEEAWAHLVLGRKFFAEGNFGSALKENEEVLLLAGRNTPIDEALFTIGLIHAHFDNLARDYGKSLIVLRKLINNYPGSLLAQQAKVIMGLLQDNENFTRRIERLNRIIDELQKADTGSEAKRAEQAKAAEQAKTITALTQENEKLSLTIERLNTIIDELKRVDIDVDQKKREKVK
jgi:tetratricopeptide (TPR) repeat protein